MPRLKKRSSLGLTSKDQLKAKRKQKREDESSEAKRARLNNHAEAIHEQRAMETLVEKVERLAKIIK